MKTFTDTERLGRGDYYSYTVKQTNISDATDIVPVIIRIIHGKHKWSVFSECPTPPVITSIEVGFYFKSHSYGQQVIYKV